MKRIVICLVFIFEALLLTSCAKDNTTTITQTKEPITSISSTSSLPTTTIYQTNEEIHKELYQRMISSLVNYKGSEVYFDIKLSFDGNDAEDSMYTLRSGLSLTDKKAFISLYIDNIEIKPEIRFTLDFGGKTQYLYLDINKDFFAFYDNTYNIEAFLKLPTINSDDYSDLRYKIDLSELSIKVGETDMGIDMLTTLLFSSERVGSFFNNLLGLLKNSNILSGDFTLNLEGMENDLIEYIYWIKYYIYQQTGREELPIEIKAEVYDDVTSLVDSLDNRITILDASKENKTFGYNIDEFEISSLYGLLEIKKYKYSHLGLNALFKLDDNYLFNSLNLSLSLRNSETQDLKEASIFIELLKESDVELNLEGEYKEFTTMSDLIADFRHNLGK